MIFVGLWRFCSRKQSTNAVKAALEAEYAAKVTAGTIARCVPVMIRLVGVDFA